MYNIFLIQVGLLQRNFIVLLRLGLISYVYDCLPGDMESCKILDALCCILYTDYWKEKYSSVLSSASSNIQTKRATRKVTFPY